MAIGYIDARLAMHRMGAVRQVVADDSAVVLHAFVEADASQREETNPGMVRATPIRFGPGGGPFIPPAPEHCAGLLRAAVALANDAPVLAIVRASWLLASIFAIHPFVDGNGRTARLLLHGLSSEAAPAGFDWGTPTTLTRDRDVYMAAARTLTDPSLPDYDARKLDPRPLMEYVINCSIDGDRQAIARFAQIVSIVDTARSSGLDESDLLLSLVVAAERNARIDELSSLGISSRELTERVVALVDRGLLAWDRRGQLQVTGRNPFLHAE